MEMNCGTMRVVTEYKNVQTGEPPAELFELPSGYTRFSSTDPSALMKMGSGGGG